LDNLCAGKEWWKKMATNRMSSVNDITASRILVVDDEDSLADMLTTDLRFAGYTVDSEATGLDALQAIKKTPPDLVILDVNLPDIDGFEVCRRIRNDGFGAPVIFLTARDSTDDLRTGFGGGGDDYLTKPFSLEELSLRIEAILRRTQSEDGSNQLTCGTLRLDDDSHQVYVNDTEIELSPTEFRLLRYLLLNQGHVLSKIQILDYVWEYDFEGNDAVVETYVSYLRKKLGPDAAELLRTVRGTGYVLRNTES
jgi:two-component system OmpR family response regulator